VQVSLQSILILIFAVVVVVVVGHGVTPLAWPPQAARPGLVRF
jgi:hypothetical protein